MVAVTVLRPGGPQHRAGRAGIAPVAATGLGRLGSPNHLGGDPPRPGALDPQLVICCVARTSDKPADPTRPLGHGTWRCSLVPAPEAGRTPTPGLSSRPSSMTHGSASPP